MIAVLTTYPVRPYLSATLAAIDSSATEPRHLFVDVVCPVTDDIRQILDVAVAEHWEWSVHFCPRPPGKPHNKHAMWTIFNFFAERNTGEDLVFFEDDVVTTKNAALYIQRFKVPDDLAWVSFYAPWGGPDVPWGTLRAKAAMFNFCQALKFPAKIVNALALRAGEAGSSHFGGSDEVLNQIGRTEGWSYGVHFPGLVQHVGEISVVGNAPAPGRTSKAFIGVYFDALMLEHRIDYT